MAILTPNTWDETVIFEKIKLSRKLNFTILLLRIGQSLLVIGALLVVSGLLFVPHIHSNPEKNYQEYFMSSGIVCLALSVLLNIINVLKIRKRKK